MFTIARLAPVLQSLFTTRADELARSTGFIRRVRAFSGARFLQTVVGRLLQQPQATLEDLAHRLGIARQSLHERFTDTAAAFVRAALGEALGHVFQAHPETLPLLDRFAGVFLDDATQLWLPDDAAGTFPGCGSGIPGLGKARMKLLLRWEVQVGGLHHLSIHAGRVADPTAAAAAPELPPGALALADLGFTDFGRLHHLSEQRVYWINRLPAQTRIFPRDGRGQPLWKYLRQQRRAGVLSVDQQLRVGGKVSVRGRLIALRCPAAVVRRRQQRLAKEAKRRNRPISARLRELSFWTVFLTNVPASWLGAAQVWSVYRVRWQIELLFKRFKSEGGLGTSRSGYRYRVECEWYLKLLGQVVRHWAALLAPISHQRTGATVPQLA